MKLVKDMRKMMFNYVPYNSFEPRLDVGKISKCYDIPLDDLLQTAHKIDKSLKNYYIKP